MNPEIKAKWVAALRSGNYQQGIGLLRNSEGKFCCLGVLCDISGAGQWTWRSWYRLSDDSDESDILLPTRLMADFNLPMSLVKTLANMNDNGAGFAAIADYIGRNL